MLMILYSTQLNLVFLHGIALDGGLAMFLMNNPVMKHLMFILVETITQAIILNLHHSLVITALLIVPAQTRAQNVLMITTTAFQQKTATIVLQQRCNILQVLTFVFASAY